MSSMPFHNNYVEIAKELMQFILGLILLTGASCSYTQSPTSFEQAKHIAGELFANHAVTLYCQCQYSSSQKEIDLGSCNMSAAGDIKRAHKMEWEHIMPAHQFGQHLKCWREPLCARQGKAYKGRACCKKISEPFRRMEAELYNLWPEVGLVNGARSNYRMAVVSDMPHFYGCAVKIDKNNKLMEPSDESKGIVARAHLFFSEQYTIRLSPSQRNLFLAWNRMHPPSDWEFEWASAIAAIEGYENKYITAWQQNQKTA